MGMWKREKCSCGYVNKLTFKNPNPDNYLIEGFVNIKDFIIAVVIYPDSKNYEGKKILIYKGYKHTNDFLRDLKKNNMKLDPHFSGDRFSPIARFAPSIEGIKMATFFCEHYNYFDKKNLV